MQLKLSSNWAATKESLLHFDSAVQLCQTNTSAKALSAFDSGSAQWQALNHPVSLSISLTSAGAEKRRCTRRQNIMQPCGFLCKKRKVWASVIAKLPWKPNNSCIDLTSKLQIQEPWSTSDMHLGRMHTLSESFRRLARLQCISAAFEASKSEGKACLLSVLGLSSRSGKLAAWSHDIHQGSVSLPQCVAQTWTLHRMGVEWCPFQKDLLLSRRVWVSSWWKYNNDALSDASSHKAASPGEAASREWMAPSRCVSVFPKPCCMNDSMFPVWPSRTSDQPALCRERQVGLLNAGQAPLFTYKYDNVGLSEASSHKAASPGQSCVTRMDDSSQSASVFSKPSCIGMPQKLCWASPLKWMHWRLLRKDELEVQAYLQDKRIDVQTGPCSFSVQELHIPC